MGLYVGSVDTGAGGGQLEGVHGKGEVMIIRVIHQKSVVDVLLVAGCMIAVRYKGTRSSSCCTLLNPSCLGQSLVVRAHTVHNNSPFTSSIDRSQRSNISGDRGTQVGLLS